MPKNRNTCQKTQKTIATQLNGNLYTKNKPPKKYDKINLKIRY